MSRPSPRRGRLPRGPWLAACTLALGAALPSQARPPALAQDPPPSEHGWSATFTLHGKAFTTLVPAAAFVLEEGESIHPLLGAPGLHAVFGGRLRIPAGGRYRFALEVEGGTAQLSLTSSAGQALGRTESPRQDGAGSTPWIELGAGEVELVLSFQRQGAARARLRTLWEMELASGRGFAREPLPASAVRPWAGAEERAARGLEELEGRVLLERKGCTSCHALDERGAQAVGRRRGPRLAKSSASADWIERWLLDPAALKPHGDMPALFGSSDEDRLDARALALWIAASAEPAATPITGGDPAAGRALYHRVGCVACHGALASPAEVLGDATHPDELPRARAVAPFGDLAGKWRAGSLADFLADPLARLPDGGMPSLALKEDEARHVASYLVERWGPASEGGPAALEPKERARAERAFVARGCGACHELGPELAPAHTAPALDALDATRGCLDPTHPSVPRYALEPSERRALALGLRTVREASGAPAPIDAARRRLAFLHCTSCHSIDGRGGPHAELRPYFTSLEEVDLGDEGRIPPDLSGVGSKLESAWLARVLAGGGVARPYMATRMPHFGPEATAGLAEALAKAVGVIPHASAEPTLTDELVLSGRNLMGRDSMACITCHVYRDLPPAGTPGTALDGFAGRLRYEWFRSFLLDPARFKPGTRMPSFGSGGRSSFRSVLEGDMQRQVDALWAYLSLGESMPPPPGLELGSSLQLRVGDSPRVFRGFVEGAGPRAIAVGFPVGIHYSFDAGAVRLVEAWQGDFLDASGAWANRGGETSGGRGQRLWSAPPGPPLVIGPRPAQWPSAVGSDAGYRFRGLRAPPGEAPVLLWSVGEVDVEELVVPKLHLPTLVRSLTLHGVTRNAFVWLRGGAHDRVLVRAASDREYAARSYPQPDGSQWFQVEGTGRRLDLRWEVVL